MSVFVLFSVSPISERFLQACLDISLHSQNLICVSRRSHMMSQWVGLATVGRPGAWQFRFPSRSRMHRMFVAKAVVAGIGEKALPTHTLNDPCLGGCFAIFGRFSLSQKSNNGTKVPRPPDSWTSPFVVLTKLPTRPSFERKERNHRKSNTSKH